MSFTEIPSFAAESAQFKANQSAHGDGKGAVVGWLKDFEGGAARKVGALANENSLSSIGIL